MKHPPRNIDLTCFNWVKIVLKTDMPSNAKYLALYLSTYMNPNQDVAWPSQKTIEGETGLANATVTKWLNLLESEGWLAIERGNRTKSNRYIITFPKRIESLVSEVPQRLGYPNEGEDVPQPLGSNNNIITIKHILGWDDWVAYRKEKKKALTPSTIKLQVKFLEGFDQNTQQAIINQSIQNGWTGLFEIKENRNARGNGKSAIEEVSVSGITEISIN